MAGDLLRWAGEDLAGLEKRCRAALINSISGGNPVIGEVVEMMAPRHAVRPDGFVDLALPGSLASGGLDGDYRPRPVARVRYAKPGRPPAELPTEPFPPA